MLWRWAPRRGRGPGSKRRAVYHARQAHRFAAGNGAAGNGAAGNGAAGNGAAGNGAAGSGAAGSGNDSARPILRGRTGIPYREMASKAADDQLR